MLPETLRTRKGSSSKGGRRKGEGSAAGEGNKGRETRQDGRSEEGRKERKIKSRDAGVGKKGR